MPPCTAGNFFAAAGMPQSSITSPAKTRDLSGDSVLSSAQDTRHSIIRKRISRRFIIPPVISAAAPFLPREGVDEHVPATSVKCLEDELGIKIFERSKNGAVLTIEGAEFVRYASEIVSKNDFILNRYKKPQLGSRLSVSTQHYDFIADAFCRLVTENEDTKYSLSLQEKETYDVIHDVEIAYSDIGIIAVEDQNFDIMNRYLQNKEISFSPIFKVSPHVFLRREHPLSSESFLLYEMLNNYPFLSYEQGAHKDSWFKEEMISGEFASKHFSSFKFLIVAP